MTGQRTHRFLRSDRWLLVMLLFLVAAVFDQSFVGRQELVRTQRTGCARGIADRLDTITVRTTQAQSDGAVAADPRQPATTRRIRRHQSAVEWASVRALRVRIDPKHGGQLDCTKAYPKPSPLPHFG